MYIPVAKSCAVREAGGPEYKRHHQTLLREVGPDNIDYKRGGSPLHRSGDHNQQQLHHSRVPAQHVTDNGEEKLNAAIQIQVISFNLI